MDNKELGRLVLKQIEYNPDSFHMKLWGARTGVEADGLWVDETAVDKLTRCGTVACLAGHAMLLSGYTLGDVNHFYRPDGSLVSNPKTEAQDLLGLGDEEIWNPGAAFSLFGSSEEVAVVWLRELCEDDG